MVTTKTTRILFGIALTSIILPCFLPIEVVYHNSGAIALFGGLVFMLSTLLAYHYQFPVDDDYRYSNNFDEIDERKNRAAIAKLIIGVISIVGGIWFIDFINNKREDSAFEKEGIIVKALITNGGQTITTTTKEKYLGLVKEESKSNSYEITVDYKLKNGEKLSVNKIITAEQYSEAYLDKEIEIIYYKPAPKMIKVLLGQENLRKYKKVLGRKLVSTDFDKMFKLSDNSIKTELLDKINVDWKPFDNGKQKGFENITSKEAIYKESNSLIYVLKDLLPESEHEAIKGANIFLSPLIIEKEEVIPSEMDLKLYYNKNNSDELNKKMIRSQAKNAIFYTKKYKVIFNMKFVKEESNLSDNSDVTDNPIEKRGSTVTYTILVFTPR